MSVKGAEKPALAIKADPKKSVGTVPVASQAPTPAPAVAGVESKADEPAAVSSILVPVDGSNESRAAFEHAVKVSDASTRLLLFHGEPQVFHVTGSGGMVAVVEPDQHAAKNTVTLRNVFLERCNSLKRDCEWITKQLIGGSATVANEIVQTANNRKAGSIVMGARGLSAFGSMMLGSVSQGVLTNSALPVTIVKSAPTIASQRDLVRTEAILLADN